uniref:Uncharacterized protein n=1 Tax=Kangiella spongicola TaxID=796379 RepID=A0A318D0N0_9GAMM
MKPYYDSSVMGIHGSTCVFNKVVVQEKVEEIQSKLITITTVKIRNTMQTTGQVILHNVGVQKVIKYLIRV